MRKGIWPQVRKITLNKLLVMKVRPEAKLPERATPGSAGLDLCACIEEPLTLEPGGHALVPTGIAIALPGADCAAFVFARSGLAVKHGLGLANGVGVIDSDYRGEVCVGLVNQYEKPHRILPGERIAQLVVMPVAAMEVTEVETLEDTSRGSGGFGSTGR